ncbi:hypothetical protein Q1695_000714 [Nippostrongylus brasiliensis]|nr:hypothetical protein Q1695_000714 [Nippostrongylus brasiliensis]
MNLPPTYVRQLRHPTSDEPRLALESRAIQASRVQLDRLLPLGQHEPQGVRFLDLLERANRRNPALLDAFYHDYGNQKMELRRQSPTALALLSLERLV